MSGNLDTSIKALATEINQLNAQGGGLMETMGRKLIEVRELLRIRNGETTRGAKVGPDGKCAPAGWGEWVRENLEISAIHARHCIWRVVDPERSRASSRTRSVKAKRSLTHLKNALQRIWPALSAAERNEAIDLMLTLSPREEQQ